MNLDATSVTAKILKVISRHRKLRAAAQKFRYLLMRGPFQKYFVKYHQRRRKNSAASLTSSVELSSQSLFPPINISKAVDEIKTQSYSACLQLPAQIINQLNSFREGEKSDNIYHPHHKCAVIKLVAADPQIISILRGYFLTEPIFYASRLYFTNPRISPDGKIHPKYKEMKIVHFDVTDYLDISVFFYLNTVDLDTSPHIVFPTTHRNKSLRDLIAGRYTEKEALERFGSNFVALLGAAGFGFFEDTSAFHIQSLGKKGRAMLSLCYTLQRKAELAQYQDNF